MIAQRQGFRKRRTATAKEIGRLYMDSVVIVETAPGSSGSPVLSAKGELIGLVVLKGDIEGTGFAVPANRLEAFLRSCTKGQPATATAPAR